jgi:site-specific recombinase XerD
MVVNGTVEKAKAHIARMEKNKKITKNNSKQILAFVAQLQAQGHKKGPYSKKRITKYLYGLGALAQTTRKDFEVYNKEDINELVFYIRNKYGQETARDYLVIFRLFIKYIWEQKGNEYEENEFPDIIKKIKPGSRQIPKIASAQLLTMDDINKMVNHTTNLRDRCFVIMLYESGCRISELIGDETHPGICLKDIKTDQYGVVIDVDGKTGSRSLRLIASAPAISNWLQEHPDKTNRDAPLFCCIWGKNKKNRTDYRYWNNLLTGKTDNRKRKTDNKSSMLGLGEKAGISKPTNPHWFRHSRASELAKHMTESQLCYYMGWEQGSKQARIYVHLCGKDVDKSILKMYGLKQEEKQEKQINPIKCPRCNKINDPFAKFCTACSLLLDEKSIVDFDKQKDETVKTIQDILDDPYLARITLKQLLPILQKLQETEGK